MPEPGTYPVGSEFEVVTETPTHRTVTRYRVFTHVEADAYDNPAYDICEVVSVQEQPKTPIGGSERKSE